MAEAKTIKLLLSNGSLTGLLVAELLKWEGILFSSPRLSYHLLSNEPESKYWGVYLLVSENQVYIGQANDLLRRINEHDKNKIWWEKVVLLTTKDNSLNRSDIDYLENKLIGIAKSRGTLEMNNVLNGNSPKVSRYRETELKDFLEGGLLLLELIGIKVFAKDHDELIHTDKQTIIKNGNSFNNDISDKNTDFNSDFASGVRINKGFAINYIKKITNISLEDGKITYASLQEKKSTYWANPSVDFVNTKWYLILNNQFERKITLLEIPDNSFSVDVKSTSNRLILRSDKPFYIDLNINLKNLVDIRSSCDFSKFIKKVIYY